MTLSAEPQSSWRDMAAIAGYEWQLPPELVPHYPQPPGGGWEGKVRDLEGKVVGEVTF